MKNIVRQLFKEFRSYQDIYDVAYKTYVNWSVFDKTLEENLRIVRFKLDRIVRQKKRLVELMTVIVIPIYMNVFAELVERAAQEPISLINKSMLMSYAVLIVSTGILIHYLREADFYEQILNRMLDDDALKDFENRIRTASECDRLGSNVTITYEQGSTVTNSETAE